MKRQAQIRGNTAMEDARVLPAGVISVDTTLQNLRLHDGVTPGGHVIPSLSNIVLGNLSAFSSKVIANTPGSLGDVRGKLVRITVPGTYQLPELSTAADGVKIVLQATVAGVSVERAAASADLLYSQGVDVTSLGLTQYEVVEVAREDAARWIVLNRY